MSNAQWRDRALAIGTVVLLLVASGAFLSTYWQSADKRAPSVGVKVGEKVKARLLATNQWTLIAVMSPECSYCTQSMPFYRRVFGTEAPISLIVAGPASPDALREYAESNGLHGLRYETVTRRDLDVAITPSLLLVDKSGIIHSLWIGQLSDAGERSVEGVIASVR